MRILSSNMFINVVGKRHKLAWREHYLRLPSVIPSVAPPSPLPTKQTIEQKHLSCQVISILELIGVILTDLNKVHLRGVG